VFEQELQEDLLPAARMCLGNVLDFSPASLLKLLCPLTGDKRKNLAPSLGVRKLQSICASHGPNRRLSTGKSSRVRSQDVALKAPHRGYLCQLHSSWRSRLELLFAEACSRIPRVTQNAVFWSRLVGQLVFLW